MNIGIYCAFQNKSTLKYAKETISILNEMSHNLSIDSKLAKHLPEKLTKKHKFFDSNITVKKEIDFLFSIGGDGTLLRSITHVKNTEVPILGINAGKLGFLTGLQKESITEGLRDFFQNKYKLVKRSLLEVKLSENLKAFDQFNYALNEVTINRKNSTSMLSIETKIDSKFLTTFWADGLIIATPTGSTGYSLSSGGPILSPQTKNLILNPISPHNINIRPLILPEKSNIKIKVTGKGKNHLMSLDSRIFSVPNQTEITLKKAPFSIFTVELENDNFLKTLSNKLFWGKDTRNKQ